MKRAGPILLVIIVALVVGVWVWRPSFTKSIKSPSGRTGANERVAADAIITTVSMADGGARTGTPASLLGETILRDYANTNLPPENDLTLMSRLMENSLLLLKSAANRPLSANEDWADLFRGKNSAGQHFLPDQHVVINERGQLVDRWRTPLFFHALGGGRFEIRSAGPDKKLWTMDDIHRNSDGSFRRGSELNPSSLMDASGPRRTPGQ